MIAKLMNSITSYFDRKPLEPVKDPEEFSQINKNDCLKIDMVPYIDEIQEHFSVNALGGMKLLTGKDEGEYLRQTLNLDEMDKNNSVINLDFPNNLDVTILFMRGLLENSINNLGFTEFYEKYKITSPEDKFVTLSASFNASYVFQTTWESFASGKLFDVFPDKGRFRIFDRANALNDLREEFGSRFPETVRELNRREHKKDYSRLQLINDFYVPLAKTRRYPEFFGKMESFNLISVKNKMIESRERVR